LEEYQIRPEDYYGSGKLFVVTSLASALKAVDKIKEQGEGANQSVFDLDHVILGDGTGREPAHYFRFKELQVGRRYAPGDTLRSGPTGPKIEVDFDAVYPIEANAKASDYERGSEIHGALVEFCGSYRKLMITLEEAFTGRRNQLIESTARMLALKNQGLALMRTPVAPGAGKSFGLNNLENIFTSRFCPCAHFCANRFSGSSSQSTVFRGC
jgi:hypothetical protein